MGHTEPRPGGHVKPPAFTRLAGAPMGRDLIRPSPKPSSPTQPTTYLFIVTISLHEVLTHLIKFWLPGRILLTWPSETYPVQIIADQASAQTGQG